MVVEDTTSKNDGLFVDYPHLIYRTDSLLKKDAQYKLIFNNNKTGKTTTAITNMVGNLLRPNVLAAAINIPVNDRFVLEFSPAKNGKVYGLDVIFNYREKGVTDPGEYEHKSITYTLPVVINNNANFSGLLSFIINGVDFKTFIESNVPVDFNNKIARPLDKISLDFAFSAGAEDFYIYYSVNQPSLTVNQSIPDFTNLSDGKGIFSSRNHNTFSDIKLTGALPTALQDSKRFD